LRILPLSKNLLDDWPISRIRRGHRARVTSASHLTYEPKRSFGASVTEVVMVRSTMWKSMRVVALAAVVSLAFGSLARGYDDDDYHRHDEASEHAYKNGYRDGARAGQYDNERGRRFNFKNDQWEDARGYQRWMGSHDQYKRAYRDGYEQGYRRAYGFYGDRRDWDRDRDNRRQDDHR
jgi:hypothetical protein